MSATKQTPFFRANSDGKELFSVQAGIPAGDAINSALCLLEGVIEILRREVSPDAHNAAVLTQMAKAVIESTRLGS